MNPKTTKREKNQFKYMATNAYALFIESKGEVSITRGSSIGAPISLTRFIRYYHIHLTCSSDFAKSQVPLKAYHLTSTL
jgi:hypothetical protein